MLTGHKIWYYAVLLVLLASNPVSGQQVDTVNTGLLQTYWTVPRLVPKFGLAVQDRPMAEIGIQWHNIYRHPLSLASKGPYASVDLMIDGDNVLIGPKAGYEFTAGVFGVAADITYYWDRNYNTEGEDRRAWAATPKAGLTLLGFLDVFYGYQIPLSSQEITSLSRHRLSVIFNLNRDYFNIKNAPRK